MSNSDRALLAERQAKRFWVSLVLLLLGLQLAIGGVAIYLAIGDPSVAVVPQYHQAALDWDQSKRARSALERNGWTVLLSASDVADDRGFRAVEFIVRDAQRQSIDQLRIVGRIYHHASAATVHTIEFQATGDGRYFAMAPMRQIGLWQIDLTIEGGNEPMIFSNTVELG